MQSQHIHNQLGQFGRILLLADDGKMARLLGAKLPSCQVDAEENVFEGLGKLSDVGSGYQYEYRAILINVERSARKTAELVRAIRKIRKEAKILLFGSPFVEGYAKPAMRAGADEFLVWPIPTAELKGHLVSQMELSRSASSRFSIGSSADTAQYHRISQSPIALERLGELAQAIPLGQATLIEKTQQMLQEALELEWVTIQTSNGTPKSIPQGKPAMEVPITTAKGQQIAKMILGPSSIDSPIIISNIEHIAAFFGTLLELAQRYEAFGYLATVDDLTGAYNWRYLRHFISQIIRQDTNTHCTLMLFDIDGFKHYNDTYGHTAGNQVLCQTTLLMRQCFRTRDVVARIGGDEFAVLFWDAGEHRYSDKENALSFAKANAIAKATCARQSGPYFDPEKWGHHDIVLFLSNRFRRIMRTNNFSMLGEEARGVLTISGGLARFPIDGKSVDELFKKADEALLTAKRSGKDCIYLVGQPEEE